MASLTNPQGHTFAFTYDAASQLTSLLHHLSGNPIASFAYSYDRVGNRSSLTDLDGTHTYAYDQLNRLIGATHPQVTNPAEAFTYDPVGNRTASHLATGQLHDAANRLLEDSNFTYAYDQNGNLVQKVQKGTGEVTTYTYEAENQLIQVTKPGMVATYRYDALGRRIEKVVNGVVTRYVYDNEDILMEFDGANQVVARYIHGPGIDEPLIMARGGQNFFYHADHLGSISALTDSTGTIVQSYTYNAFGRIVAQGGTVNNPYTYTAREFDSETGMYYHRTRYYDPSVGRFLSEDRLNVSFIQFIKAKQRVPFNVSLALADLPISHQLLNLYPYVGSNPIRFRDPFGFQEVSEGELWLTVALGISAGVVIGVGLAFELPAVVLVGSVAEVAIVAYEGYKQFKKARPIVEKHRKEIEEALRQIQACPVPLQQEQSQ